MFADGPQRRGSPLVRAAQAFGRDRIAFQDLTLGVVRAIVGAVPEVAGAIVGAVPELCAEVVSAVAVVVDPVAGVADMAGWIVGALFGLRGGRNGCCGDRRDDQNGLDRAGAHDRLLVVGLPREP
jgi:hypothetical protein